MIMDHNEINVIQGKNTETKEKECLEERQNEESDNDNEK